MRYIHAFVFMLLTGMCAIAGSAHAGTPVGTPAGCTAVQVRNMPPYQNGGTYYQCRVDTTRFPVALCNDGSPGVFQIQPAARPSMTWVIWLEGGYDCTSTTSCAHRATNPKTRKHSTSIGTPVSAGAGVLSHDAVLDPALANANTVLVHYCSNDIWSGARRPAKDAGGYNPTDISTWYFEGRSILRAVIGTLKTLDVGFRGPLQVLIGGTSAGAYGAEVNVNDLVSLVPPRAQLSLLLDAGFTLDIGGFDPTRPPPYVGTGPDTPFYQQVSPGIPLWRGRGDKICASRAKSLAEQVACYDTANLLLNGYVTVPTFVAESLIDSADLPGQLCPATNGRCTVPHDPNSQQGMYVTYYGKRMAALISDNGASNLPYTAFSPDQYAHALMDDSTVFTTPFQFSSGQITPRDAFDAWWSNINAPGGVYLGSGPGVD